MKLKEINVEELLHMESPTIIDVRSPIEYSQSAIPGAINIPLFSNDERAEIGTIYKNEGPDKAKWRAMEMVAPKLPTFLGEIKALREHSKHLIVHCWRGGMRSNAVVTFLEFAGIHVKLLKGGYKGYREYILSEIPKILPEKAVVIHGLTGVGKTEILKRLEEKGFPVLDLEGMANHRGSIFGSIGLGESHNQKTFDSLLYQMLQEIKGSSYFLMEAESKRIGKITLPDEMMNKRNDGIHFYLHTSLKHRVDHIINEYISPYEHLPWYHKEISESLERVLRRVKDGEIKSSLLFLLENHHYQEMIPILLEDYYDPKYDYKQQEYTSNFIDIFAESHDEFAEKIALELKKLSLNPIQK